MTFYFMRANRDDMVLDALDTENRHLSAADRQRKYRKMSASPYRFFRGTNHLYWGDVWHDWRYYLYGGLRDTQTWLQGDAHAHNHGAYGDDRQGVHYGMDDFDDAVIGDYQFDLWRHAASMVLDAQDNANLSPPEVRRVIRHLLSTYLDTLVAHIDGRPLDDVHVNYIKKPLGPFIRKVRHKRGRARILAKWTRIDDGQRYFNTEYKKLGTVSARERGALLKALDEEYPQTLRPDGIEAPQSHFAVKDVARRVNAGIGSLGLSRYYALIEGATDSPDDGVILDIKEQTPPPAYRYMNTRERRAWRKSFAHEAERHARAFEALANHPDAYLGWLTLGDKRFSVRQRSPYRKDFPTHKVKGFKQYRRLTRQWGRILAREHIRGAHALRPHDPGFFCRAVTDCCQPYREAFKEMVVDLAFTYERCVQRDYALFLDSRGYP